MEREGLNKPTPDGSQQVTENAMIALMTAAFIINGIKLGPNMIAEHPYSGVVASTRLGNCFLL